MMPLSQRLRFILVNAYVTFSFLTDYKFYALLWGWLRGALPDLHTDISQNTGEELPFPVDLVYTWVDGADPKHIASRTEAAKKQGGNADVALDPRLYTDHGELRLSLRSVEKFLPWVRTIFIVTDGQTPDWLNTSHSKIRIIDHRQIFPDASRLPIFNAESIEFHLHNIPDLSEHFIYCNDDMFFGKPCNKSDFFVWDGTSSKLRLNYYMYIFPSFVDYLFGDKQTAVWKSSLNNLRCFLELRYPMHKIRQTFLHQAAPLKKSLLEQLVQTYPKLYEQSSRHRFRDCRDIPPVQMVSHLAVIHHNAVIAPISQCYFKAVEAFKACVAQGALAKLCCINQLTEAVDLCGDALGIDFCRTPSAFEKS